MHFLWGSKETFFHGAGAVKCNGITQFAKQINKGEKMDTSPHKSDFVKVNGVRLHYLDWGGEGETLLFLPGLGNSAHIFDDFAPRFKDKFRVIALTRRGHGDSDCPESGYDVDNLTEDIRRFMDALGVDTAILAGHSMAYVEQTRMCALHPERISKLVCLDAAYDRTKFKPLMEKNPLKEIQIPEQDCYSMDEFTSQIKQIRPDLAEIWSELWDEETHYTVTTDNEGKIDYKMSEELHIKIIASLRDYVPEEATIKVPVLSFYAIWDKPFFPEYLTEEQKASFVEFIEQTRLPVQRECIEQFRRNVPRARVVEIPQGNHYCFISHEDLVYEKMRKFLLE